MKDLLAQLRFLDIELLPLYGIKSIKDYESEVSFDVVKNDNTIIKKMNALLPTIKNIFVVQNFNLHKTNDRFQSATQVFAVLKKILTMCMVPFKIVNKKGINFVRLVPDNNVLRDYRNKMLDIRDQEVAIAGTQTEKKVLRLEDLEKNVLKIYEDNIYFPLCVVNDKSIQLNHSIVNARGITVKFVTPSGQIRSHTRIYCRLVFDKEVVEEFTIKNGRDEYTFLENIIVPYSLVKFTKISIDFVGDIYDDDTIIQICYKCVDFNKKFHQKLTSHTTTVCIERDHKKIEISEGVLTYASVALQKTSKSKIIQRFSVNSKKYCRMSCLSFTEATAMIVALVENKVDYVLCELANVPFKLAYSKIIDDKLVLHVSIVVVIDGFSDLQILIPGLINPTNHRISVCRDGEIKQFNTKIRKGGAIICNLDNNAYVSTKYRDLRIVIEIDKSNSVTDVCRSILLMYDAIVISCPKERSACQDHVIDREKIIDN